MRIIQNSLDCPLCRRDCPASRTWCIVLLFLALCSTNLGAQNIADVRKTTWGMSLEEVRLSEHPMIPSEITASELVYSNVDLSGRKATIYYTFTNGKLAEVRYLMYGYDNFFSRGTCEKIIPLQSKVQHALFVIEALKTKGMQCNSGWHLLTTENSTPVGYDNCSLDSETIKSVDLAAKRENCFNVILSYENKRTSASFWFNEHQNGAQGTSRSSFSCNSDYYNIYYRLVFEPSYKLKSQISSGNF